MGGVSRPPLPLVRCTAYCTCARGSCLANYGCRRTCASSSVIVVPFPSGWVPAVLFCLPLCAMTCPCSTVGSRLARVSVLFVPEYFHAHGTSSQLLCSCAHVSLGIWLDRSGQRYLLLDVLQGSITEPCTWECMAVGHPDGNDGQDGIGIE